MKPYVLVAGDFSPHGGMDRANYELAWYLANTREAKVHLVGHLVAPPLATHPNVVWHVVPRPFNRHFFGGHLLARAGRRVSLELGVEARVIVNGGNCPIRAINWVHAVHAAWNNRDAHAPIAFRLRNHIAKEFARRTERKALRLARFVITNSEAARRQIIDRHGIPENRVRVVYLSADAEQFKPLDANAKAAARSQLDLPIKSPVAAFVGALGHDRNKGFDILFDAWERLCQNPDWDATLIVAGGGAEVDLWRAKAAGAGLTARVKILGFTRNVPQLLGAADLLVSPTFYDAYGLGVHEALCCGLPAIVSQSAGVAERLEGDLTELLLASPPTVDELIVRLWHWRSNLDRFRKSSLAFSERLRADTWSRMAQEIVSITEEQYGDNGTRSVSACEIPQSGKPE